MPDPMPPLPTLMLHRLLDGLCTWVPNAYQWPDVVECGRPAEYVLRDHHGQVGEACAQHTAAMRADHDFVVEVRSWHPRNECFRLAEPTDHAAAATEDHSARP